MTYYDLSGVREVLPERLDALRSVLAPGSVILDLGCNDGRIGRALRESGHASRVVGVDLERTPGYQGQEFIPLDLRRGELEGLPEADVVLFLNVAHHLLLQGRAFVRQLLARMLERWPVVLLDMGSVTETADWSWRTLMGRLWPSDQHMWSELFEPARWRRPLLSYRFQGGTRVLWKLVGEREQSYEYDVLERWRRIETNNPLAKRFLPEGHPGGYDGVVFHTLRRRGTKELFWAKRPLLWRDEPQRHLFEDQVEMVVRRLPVLASLSIERHPEWGRIYPYLPELKSGLVVHYSARHDFLTPSQSQEAERVARASAGDGPIANIPLGLLTDFQFVSTSFGLIFLDWEPDHQQPLVEAMLKGHESARREAQEQIYCPRREEALLERALQGAMLPDHALTPAEARRLAQELLRRAQFLRRAGVSRWAWANYRAAFSLGTPALQAWWSLFADHWRRRWRGASG